MIPRSIGDSLKGLGPKGENLLSAVLFYVDDILIWSQILGEAEAIFGMLSKKYKLKQTGIIVEHKAGEVSFLGRRVFRTKECQGTNVIFFGLSPEYLDSCCEEFQITKGTDKLPYRLGFPKGLSRGLSLGGWAGGKVWKMREHLHFGFAFRKNFALIIS